jgi:hypothetical protein
LAAHLTSRRPGGAIWIIEKIDDTQENNSFFIHRTTAHNPFHANALHHHGKRKVFERFEYPIHKESHHAECT